MRKILYRVSYKKETVTVNQYLRDMKNITAKSVTISVIHMPDSRPFDNRKNTCKLKKRLPAFLPIEAKQPSPFLVARVYFGLLLLTIVKKILRVQ